MIASRIKELHRRNPSIPIMVVVGSLAEATELYQSLCSRGIQAQCLTDYINYGPDGRIDSEDKIVARAGKAGTITVATTVAGRGTDITLDQQSKVAGGMHIILGCFPISERIQHQVLGRASRQGNRGSSEVIISPSSDVFLKSLPAPVVSCMTFWANNFGPNDSWCEKLFRLVRDVITLYDMGQRHQMRQSADMAFCVLERYVERHKSITQDAVAAEVQRRWSQYSIILEAKLAHLREGKQTMVPVAQDTTITIGRLIYAAFGMNHAEIKNSLKPKTYNSFKGAVLALIKMLDAQRANTAIGTSSTDDELDEGKVLRELLAEMESAVFAGLS